MNTHFRSLYYGLCLALFFIGLFGLVIDFTMWQLSMGLMIVGSIFAFFVYKAGKEYE